MTESGNGNCGKGKKQVRGTKYEVRGFGREDFSLRSKWKELRSSEGYSLRSECWELVLV